MEEKKEEKKTKKPKKKGYIVLNTILIVLLLIAFLGIGYAVGSTQMLKGFDLNNKGAVEKSKTTSSKVENLSIVDKRIAKALRSFEQIGLNPEDIYESDVTKLSKKELIITALKGLEFEQINYCKMNETDLTIPITIDDLNKSLKNAIPDGKISQEDITNNANKTTSYSIGGYGYTFKFANGTLEEYSIKLLDNKIYVIGPCGHEGPNEVDIKTKVVKAELSGEYLYVYQNVAFGKTEFLQSLDSFVYDYYKDKDFKTKEETKTLNEEPSWEIYDTYKITFKKNGKNYYFESSEKE